jgi:hypothetical protein
LDLDEGFGQQGSGHSPIIYGRPATAVDEVLMAPAMPISSPRATTEGGDDDDDSSSRSFSEEFRQQNKGIVQEVKFILSPVVTAGRKLMRRKSDGAALKRADGCLT